MGQDLLVHCLEPFDSTAISVISGDSLPDPEAFDGYMIMGSEFSVNDNSPWIESLLVFIKDVVQKQIPLVGICFGHQAIAKALGGTVKSGDWVVGATRYDRADTSQPLTTIAYHEDQVVVAPPEATLLMNSADCPIASLRYQYTPCWTIQSHPEFTPCFALELFEHTRGRPLTDDICDAAIASVNDFTPDLGSIHQEIRQTFQS
jgi:GMP synthase-like glutamine amidotransferase